MKAIIISLFFLLLLFGCISKSNNDKNSLPNNNYEVTIKDHRVDSLLREFVKFHTETDSSFFKGKLLTVTYHEDFLKLNTIISWIYIGIVQWHIPDSYSYNNGMIVLIYFGDNNFRQIINPNVFKELSLREPLVFKNAPVITGTHDAWMLSECKCNGEVVSLKKCDDFNSLYCEELKAKIHESCKELEYDYCCYKK